MEENEKKQIATEDCKVAKSLTADKAETVNTTTFGTTLQDLSKVDHIHDVSNIPLSSVSSPLPSNIRGYNGNYGNTLGGLITSICLWANDIKPLTIETYTATSVTNDFGNIYEIPGDISVNNQSYSYTFLYTNRISHLATGDNIIKVSLGSLELKTNNNDNNFLYYNTYSIKCGSGSNISYRSYDVYVAYSYDITTKYIYLWFKFKEVGGTSFVEPNTLGYGTAISFNIKDKLIIIYYV